MSHVLLAIWPKELDLFILFSLITYQQKEKYPHKNVSNILVAQYLLLAMLASAIGDFKFNFVSSLKRLCVAALLLFKVIFMKTNFR